MRVHRTSTTAEQAGASDMDGAALFGLGLLVFASLVRVVAAIARAETFGAEATMAFMVLLGVAVASARYAVDALRRHRGVDEPTRPANPR